MVVRRFPWPLRPGATLAALILLGATAAGQNMTLDYVGRYNCQSGQPDHLMYALEVSGDRAVVASNQGLALVDLAALPVAGTQSYLHRITGLNARNLYLKDGQWIFADLHRDGTGGSFGFAVVQLAGNTLTHVKTVDEPDVFYEKMCLVGDTLFVAAHAHGLRVFDVTSPAAPVLLGKLEKGLVDAFAVAVDGTKAYVADGAGGLKILDVSNKAQPVLLGGEDTSSAVGTAQDVRVSNGTVYVAGGGAGLLVYPGGQPNQRIVVPLSGCAKELAWLGDDLAVATIGGFVVLDTAVAGPPAVVAAEVTARRGSGTLRLCSAVSAATGNRLLCGDWNSMDVYRLQPAAASAQADATASHQRIRFRPDGGTQQVTLRNDGAAALAVGPVVVQPATFSCNYAGGTIPPGGEVSLEIAYAGSGVAAGSGLVRFGSNDPDESPLPIQVFGNTGYLDPGEPSIDFTVKEIWKDPGTGLYVEQPFTLSSHLGELLWFQIYGSW